MRGWISRAKLHGSMRSPVRQLRSVCFCANWWQLHATTAVRLHERHHRKCRQMRKNRTCRRYQRKSPHRGSDGCESWLCRLHRHSALPAKEVETPSRNAYDGGKLRIVRDRHHRFVHFSSSRPGIIDHFLVELLLLMKISVSKFTCNFLLCKIS